MPMAFSSIHEESTWNPTLKINLLIEEPSFTTLILSGALNRIPLRNEFSFMFKATPSFKLRIIFGSFFVLNTSTE